MYIVWRSAEAEAEFYRNSSHQAISRWSVGSRLTPAMRLDHFVFDPPRGIVAVGGFRAFEAEGDLPAELDLEQLLP